MDVYDATEWDRAEEVEEISGYVEVSEGGE